MISKIKCVAYGVQSSRATRFMELYWCCSMMCLTPILYYMLWSFGILNGEKVIYTDYFYIFVVICLLSVCLTKYLNLITIKHLINPPFIWDFNHAKWKHRTRFERKLGLSYFKNAVSFRFYALWGFNIICLHISLSLRYKGTFSLN